MCKSYCLSGLQRDFKVYTPVTKSLVYPGYVIIFICGRKLLWTMYSSLHVWWYSCNRNRLGVCWDTSSVMYRYGVSSFTRITPVRRQECRLVITVYWKSTLDGRDLGCDLVVVSTIWPFTVHVLYKVRGFRVKVGLVSKDLITVESPHSCSNGVV